MNKHFKYSVLLAYYGGLLTKKQFDIMQRHYEFDHSLGEIAESLCVSRQGVMGTITKAQKVLDNFESILHIREKTELIVQKLERIKSDISACSIDEIIKILEE